MITIDEAIGKVRAAIDEAYDRAEIELRDSLRHCGYAEEEIEAVIAVGEEMRQEWEPKQISQLRAWIKRECRDLSS